MNQSCMSFFDKWFNEYVQTFHTGDMNIDVNYVLKEEHTQRVRINCIHIANSLDFNENDRLLAEVIGLFHDIGRFKQYCDYKSFSDARTGSHATIGVGVLKETGILSCLQLEEKNVILDSIEYHNMLAIPKEVSGRTLLFSQLIRDADKLDAFYIVTNDNEPRQYNVEPLIKENLFSQSVFDCLLQCKNIEFKEVKTYCDRKMLEMSLIYDMNFQFSKEQVTKKGYIDKLINFLPESGEKGKIINHFSSYFKN